MSFGHYTAFCKNNNGWYDFDDSSVTKVDDEKVITEAAYNLFYKIRGFCEEEQVDFELIRNKLDDQFKDEQNLIDQDMQDSIADFEKKVLDEKKTKDMEID
jgi:hypothetical protein